MSAMRGTPEVFGDSNGNINTTAGQTDLVELMASTLASLAVGGSSSSTSSPKINASRLYAQTIILSNLGRILFRLSRLTEALAVSLTISTIRKSLLGVISHMAIAVIEYNIGLIKHKMGNSVEAKTHYENFLTTATLPIESGGVENHHRLRSASNWSLTITFWPKGRCHANSERSFGPSKVCLRRRSCRNIQDFVLYRSDSF